MERSASRRAKDQGKSLGGSLRRIATKDLSTRGDWEKLEAELLEAAL